MQRVYAHTAHGIAHQTFGDATLFAGSRQEHQHVPLGCVKRLTNHASGRGFHPLVTTRRAIMRLDAKHAALAAQHRRRATLVRQQRRHRHTIERRRHDQYTELLAKMALRFEHQRQPQVGLQRPFVKLVEDHEADALQRRIAAQHARQHAFGHHFDTGALRDTRFATHAVAHRLADFFAQNRRHVRRRSTRRESPRFEHDQLCIRQPRLVDQRQRHTGGLAGTWWRLEHGHGACSQRST